MTEKEQGSKKLFRKWQVIQSSSCNLVKEDNALLSNNSDRIKVVSSKASNVIPASHLKMSPKIAREGRRKVKFKDFRALL